jgi:hypothetical protein
MTLYNVLKFFHIVAAVLFAGGLFLCAACASSDPNAVETLEHLGEHGIEISSVHDTAKRIGRIPVLIRIVEHRNPGLTRVH